MYIYICVYIYIYSLGFIQVGVWVRVCLVWSLGALDLTFGAGAWVEKWEFRAYSPPEVDRIIMGYMGVFL